MRAIRGRDTKPELLVRSVLHRLGYRFRVAVRGIAGTPDIVFRAKRKAIFVHGCFWHRHAGCRNSYEPKSRVDFWQEKFARNVERDGEVAQAIEAAGWAYLVVWQCEAVDGSALRERLIDFLGPTAMRVGNDD